MILMCAYFKIETDAAQILINDFFLILTVGGPFQWKDFKWEKQGGTGLISEKIEVFSAEHNRRAEAVTDGYSQPAIFTMYLFCACC